MANVDGKRLYICFEENFRESRGDIGRIYSLEIGEFVIHHRDFMSEVHSVAKKKRVQICSVSFAEMSTEIYPQRQSRLAWVFLWLIIS